MKKLYVVLNKLTGAITDSLIKVIKSHIVAAGVVFGPLVDKFCRWILGVIERYFSHGDGFALAGAVSIEYGIRTKKYEHAAFHLENRCSICHTRGHNKQNHGDEWDRFLKAQGLLEEMSRVSDVLTQAENSGWNYPILRALIG